MRYIQHFENVLDIGPMFEERNEAFDDGFEEIWVELKGHFLCLSHPTKIFNTKDLNIQKKYIKKLRLTLYLIATKKGTLRGTTYKYDKHY